MTGKGKKLVLTLTFDLSEDLDSVLAVLAAADDQDVFYGGFEGRVTEMDAMTQAETDAREQHGLWQNNGRRLQ